MRGIAGSLLLLAVACVAKNPDEAGWDDPDIVLEGHPQYWKLVPKPNPGDPAPHPPHDDVWKSNKASIVVLVAALRETRCGETLKNLFSKAEHPNRVHIAVVQQNEESDEDCVEAYCRLIGAPGKVCENSGNVRMMRMKASEAQGPVFARAQQVKLLTDDDDFCMQVDAHTDAVQNWDRLMLEQWGMTNNEYAVISTYPTNAADNLGKNANNHWEMPHICQANLGYRGQISNHQASAAANLKSPILAPLWAAGLSFSRCHAERNVPNDEKLKGIFSGEEYSRGARLWTHGYDFYSPTRPWIGTWYGGQKGNKGTWHTESKDLEYAQERLMTLLKWPSSDQTPTALAKLKGYNLGTRRSLTAYGRFSGVDTQKGVLYPKQCGKLYVPWDNSDDVYSEYQGSDDVSNHQPRKVMLEPKLMPRIKERPPSKPKNIMDRRTNEHNRNPPSEDTWEDPSVHMVDMNAPERPTLRGSMVFLMQIMVGSVVVIVGLLFAVFKVLNSRQKQAIS